VLLDAVAGRPVGTAFQPRQRSLSARKLWIGFAAGTEGALIVDEGARRALVERGTSLLPAGILEVAGQFEEGDVVEVRDPNGVAFARGLVLSDADVLRQHCGRRSADLPAHMPHEAIHRDDLVLLVQP
jgi:glutamate 5-kinase